MLPTTLDELLNAASLTETPDPGAGFARRRRRLHAIGVFAADQTSERAEQQGFLDFIHIPPPASPADALEFAAALVSRLAEMTAKGIPQRMHEESAVFKAKRLENLRTSGASGGNRAADQDLPISDEHSLHLPLIFTCEEALIWLAAFLRRYDEVILAADRCSEHAIANSY